VVPHPPPTCRQWSVLSKLNVTPSLTPGDNLRARQLLLHVPDVSRPAFPYHKKHGGQ
jgi:hypothetical protein